MYFYFYLFYLTINLKHVVSDSDDYTQVSSWFTDGHPILRKIEQDNDTASSEDYNVQPPPPDGYWVADLRSDIKSTINKYGYSEAKPHIEKLVQNAEKDHNVLLQIKAINENDDLTRRHRHKHNHRDKEIFIRIKHNNVSLREVDSLRQRVFYLVDSLGYDTAKPYLLKAIEGRSKIYFEPENKELPTTEYTTLPTPSMELETENDIKSYVLPLVERSAHNISTDSRKPSEPNWLESFKEFVKVVVKNVSKDELARNLNSGALENEYGIKLQNLNLNVLGHLTEKSQSQQGETSRKVYEEVGQRSGDSRWKEELRGYVKSLATVLSQEKVLERLTPVVKSLEQSHNIIIKDIDIDNEGEVYVDVEKVKKKYKRTGDATWFKNSMEIYRKSYFDDDRLHPNYSEHKLGDGWNYTHHKYAGLMVHEGQYPGLMAPDGTLGKPKTPEEMEVLEWISDFKLFAMYLARKYPTTSQNIEYTVRLNNAIDYYQKKYDVEIKNFHQGPSTQPATFDIIFRDNAKIPILSMNFNGPITTTTIEPPNHAPDRPNIDESYLHDQEELDLNYEHPKELNVSVFDYPDLFFMHPSVVNDTPGGM